MSGQTLNREAVAKYLYEYEMENTRDQWNLWETLDWDVKDGWERQADDLIAACAEAAS